MTQYKCPVCGMAKFFPDIQTVSLKVGNQDVDVSAITCKTCGNIMLNSSDDFLKEHHQEEKLT